MVLHPCSEPGCPILTAGPRCPAHAQAFGRVQLYSTPAWRILRAAFLAAHPCCNCGCGQPSTEVDHIQPVRLGGAPLDPANLQALAKGCHSRKTLEETRHG